MIRQLRPGESIPAGKPARYGSDHGYIRLRWKVGPRAYLETYEHRVVGDRVTTAEHVHHRNGRRDDNRPENLQPLSEREHADVHASPYAATVVSLYESGLATTEIGSRLGLDPSAVLRLLQRRNVQTRKSSDYGRPLDSEAVRELHAAGIRVLRMAQILGVSRARIDGLLDGMGLPRFSPGRPPAEKRDRGAAA